MADYTVVNLEQIKDEAPRFGLSPGLEAHFARVPLKLEQSGISLQRLAPGFRVPFGHKHEVQEELYLLLSGSARAKLEDEIVEMKPWDAIRVPGTTIRCFEAGPKGAELLAFGAPSTENRDTKMIGNWWTD